MNRRLYALLVPFVALLLAIGCTRTTETPGSGGSPATEVDMSQYEKLQAVIETEKGNIIVVFYPKDAPKTVANFVTLAKKGFYNGLAFHRVVPDFVVQGGDPLGTGEGGPGYTIPAEFNQQKHLRGTLAMARTSDPNSAGSQFYICLAPQPNLDNQYTVFGQVVRGMENVDKIKKGDKMLKVRIEPLEAGAAPPQAGASPAVTTSPAAVSSPATTTRPTAATSPAAKQP